MIKHIGNIRNYTLKNIETYGITSLRQILPSSLFNSINNKNQRNTTLLRPEVVFWLMSTVSLYGGSMTGAISTFWNNFRGEFPYLKHSPITEEAFCYARKNLKLRFFIEIFKSVVLRFQKKYYDDFQWKGFRLLGIDGMQTKLPPSKQLRKHFPPSSNKSGNSNNPQALIVGLVGIFTGICYEFTITTNKRSEQSCARKLIKDNIGEMDLLLCDRNFPDYHTLALMDYKKGHFLFHLSKNRFNRLARTKTKSGRKDEWYVTLVLPSKLVKQYPQFKKEITVRIIQYQRTGYRASFLITSLLDTELYCYEELVDLYHERWRQETMFREWKYSLSISNLRSTTVVGIKKEIYTQLTINNVIRWIMSEAAGSENLRPVDFKFLESKRIINSYTYAMSNAKIELLPSIYRNLIKEIAPQKIMVRPNRHYPRPNDGKIRNKGNGIHVKPAKLLNNERLVS